MSIDDMTPAQLRARIKELDQVIAGQPDQTIYDTRVTSIRVANPTLSLAEAQKLARSHALEEGFYAPAIGTSGFESLPLNDDEAPTLTDLLAEDMATDPRVADALRWDALTPEQKADEKDGIALHKRLSTMRDALLNQAKATGSTEAVAGLDMLITQSTASDGVRKAARAIYDGQKAAPKQSDGWNLLDGIEGAE